eukprot:CAMPEP_0174850854 /NCGR_PEP_ID=MMETSP1114-20130205/21176_1 /TAXON_ID=312471 /ORGANISM="Neobodo designis, Strain CCAP 1951/1" /LENGTH=387 /DNA_ID=CAMNT_0016085345 /DNA_START=38 /DNA_END=1201 /DNA_ORIENTATION=-
MGGCCSCGEDARQVDKDEAEARNPKPPYADWAALMKADWGSDPTAVSRDFSRMRIMVTGPDGPRTHLADVPLTPENTAEIEKRNRELRAVTVAISKLMEPEGSDVPSRLEEAWARAIDTDDLKGSPDISSGIAKLLQDELQFYTGRDDVKTDPLERNATFNALLLFAQGTVFYPGQRIGHLLWFPWTNGKMRDVAWTVYVTDEDRYPSARYYDTPAGVSKTQQRRTKLVKSGDAAGNEADEDAPLVGGDTSDGNAKNKKGNHGSSDLVVGYGAADDDSRSGDVRGFEKPKPRPATPGCVSIVHSFAMRNYVDKEERSYVPAFMVQWAVVITLRKGTGEWVSATLEVPEVFCETCDKSKLQRLRRQRLDDAVFNAFGVQVQPIASLDL